MTRKLDGFVLFGAIDPPSVQVPARREARRRFTQLEQVTQLVGVSEADADVGFMARLLALCSLPRTNPGNRKEYIRRNGPYTLGMSAGSTTSCPTATCRVCSWRGCAPKRYERKTARSSSGVRWPISCGVWVSTTMAAQCGGGSETRCSGSFVPMWNCLRGRARVAVRELSHRG